VGISISSVALAAFRTASQDSSEKAQSSLCGCWHTACFISAMLVFALYMVTKWFTGPHNSEHRRKHFGDKSVTDFRVGFIIVQ
jgi:hypothetical protein